MFIKLKVVTLIIFKHLVCECADIIWIGLDGMRFACVSLRPSFEHMAMQLLMPLCTHTGVLIRLVASCLCVSDVVALLDVVCPVGASALLVLLMYVADIEGHDVRAPLLALCYRRELIFAVSALRP